MRMKNGLADPQQGYGSSSSTSTDASNVRRAFGTALGVLDGALRGGQDDVNAVDFSPENHIQPGQSEICVVYQEFFEAPCTNSQQTSDFVNAYSAAYEIGYVYGYSAGYFLSGSTLGSLYQGSSSLFSGG